VKDDQEKGRTALGVVGATLGVLLSIGFLLNLTMGVVEIPDNLPIVGNIDEVLASAILFSCLNYLGLNIIPFQRKLESFKRKE